MKKKNLIVGLIFILTGIWFYSALSSFHVEEGEFLKKIIVREGTVTSQDEVAEALAKDMGFDLDGAYKSGYTSTDVIEYLLNEPHKLSVTYYKGNFYVGRVTVLRAIPAAICTVLIIVGVIAILTGLRKKPKSAANNS